MIKLFLDTNILLGTLIPDRKEHISCLSILLQNNIQLVTNEYVIKETRKILEEIYLFDSEDIHRFMEFIRCKIELVTDDIPTKKDAQKYITALGLREAIDIIKIQIAKNTSKFAKRKSL